MRTPTKGRNAAKKSAKGTHGGKRENTGGARENTGPKPTGGIKRTAPINFRTTEETAAWFREQSQSHGGLGPFLEHLHTQATKPVETPLKAP